MASRGKSILHVLHRTRFSPETIQQIIAKPLPPPRLAFPHLYYEPFTRYATERQGSYANGWERQRFPFVPERLPRLPEIHDPVIRERVFTHLSARTELPKRGLKHKRVMDRWLESYKRYEGLGDVVINHAASLAAEKSRTKASYGIAIKLLSNNTLSYLSYSYQLHHELRHINPEMRQPPQKIFADIFEAYIGAMYVEAESRGEEQLVFDWLAELFDPSNWPEWPTATEPSWKEKHATVDAAALHRMLRTIINRPASRGVPINKLPRRGAEAGDASVAAGEIAVQTTTSGRVTRRRGRRTASKADRVAKNRPVTSTLKVNPYKALLLARRAAQYAMLREEQRLAGMVQPSRKTSSSATGSSPSPTPERSQPAKAASTSSTSSLPHPPASLVVVRAGPPSLPGAWLRMKMARMRAAHRK